MKKIKLFCLLFISIIFTFPLQALAVEFTIVNTEINAYLQKNGDVYVSEKHTYSFDGEFNGIIRTLIPKAGSEIVNFEAFEGDFPLIDVQDYNEYRIYRAGVDETITIELKYTIKNGVDVYTDVAEFYWPFFDESNSSTYENMDIFVHPPETTETVIAFGYDEAYNSAIELDDGVVHFAMGKVASEQNGDIRVVYDKELFPNVMAPSNKTMMNEILADKEELDSFAQFTNTLDSIAPVLFMTYTLYILGLLFYSWRVARTKKVEAERQFSTDFILPKEVMSLPATIMYMGSTALFRTQILIASMLELVRKGFIERIEKNKFVLISKNTDFEHEKVLIEWLFERIGRNGKFHFSTLKRYVKKKANQKRFNEDFKKWLNAVEEELNSHNLQEKRGQLKFFIFMTSVLLLPFTILFAIHELVMWMTISIVLSTFLFFFSLFYISRTVKGVGIRFQWKQFSRNFPQIEANHWEKWSEDDQMRALIYGIGVANKRIKEKNKQFFEGLPQKELFQTYRPSLLDMWLMSNVAEQSFIEANASVTGGSSSGGGYSGGGGSGVGGGGGGSDAF